MKLEDIAALRNMASRPPTSEDRARIRIAELDFDVDIGPTGHYFLTAPDGVKQRDSFGSLECALRIGEREFAVRIHTMRMHHHDPCVRAEAHGALAALNASEASTEKLSEVLASDAQIRANAVAARAIRASAAALTVAHEWPRRRDAAINEAHNEATRAQAQEAVTNWKSYDPNGGQGGRR